MRGAFSLLLLVAACAATPEPVAPVVTAPGPRERTRDGRPDPVLARALHALEERDLDAALAGLERDRWLATDRGGAALLFAGCLLARGRHADAIDVLRDYLGKTARAKDGSDAIAIRLLRHDATGGGERARTAREACYFGLYALGALGEPETAHPDLARALREAPRAEQLLVGAAWQR